MADLRSLQVEAMDQVRLLADAVTRPKGLSLREFDNALGKIRSIVKQAHSLGVDEGAEAVRAEIRSILDGEELPEIGWDRLREHYAETDEMFPPNGDIERWEDEGGAPRGRRTGRNRGPGSAAARPVPPRGHDGGAEPGRSAPDPGDEHDHEA